jgi:hypothetical protein
MGGAWDPQCFFCPFLCYTQSGDDSQEDLAKFGYTLNMKEK